MNKNLIIRSKYLLFVICILVSRFVAAQTFTPVGSAVPYVGGGFVGAWNLTPSSGCGTQQAGAIWSSHKVDFTQTFTVTFRATLDAFAGGGADGIAVVFGSKLTTASLPNGPAGQLGVYGSNSDYTSNCFNVEYDSYDNGVGANDIPDDHVAVCYNGNSIAANTLAGPASIAAFAGAGGITNGISRDVEVTWVPAINRLSVYYNCNLALICNYDFRTMFTHPNSVQWGFTAATGGACSNQIIDLIYDTAVNITYRNDTGCAGSPLLLFGPIDYPNYTWSTGETSQNILVNASGTYTVLAYDGCVPAEIIYKVYMNPLPAPITGHNKVCIGDTVHLSDATAGGTWHSSNAHATVSGSGIVTGVSSGITVISYTVGGCPVYDTITVNLLPTITTTISNICKGDPSAFLHFSVSGAIITYQITWTAGSGIPNMSGTLPNSPPTLPINTINASVGVHTATIKIANPAGCTNEASFSFIVNPTPNHIGPDGICVHAQLQLSDLPLGGTWSSYNGNATITNGGLVTGVHPGIDTIFYTNDSGCKAKDTLTIHPLPDPGTITYPTSPVHMCLGTTDTLGETAPGGTWLSDNPSVLQITGVSGTHCNVHALSMGTANVLYIVTNSFLCKDTAIKNVTIDTNGIFPITGILGVCADSTTQLSDATPNGTWHSSNNSIATISATGLVTGHMSGLDTIRYTMSNACGTFTTWVTVVVNMPPYIKTNSVIACQSLPDGKGNATILDDANGCIKVCDSSVIRYYAGGVNGAVFTWSVIGGTIVANYGDSIDVLWQVVGMPASITLYATYGTCVSERSVCIQVIEKPHAAFSVLPDLTPATGVIPVCLNTNVYFHDLSTGDPQSQIVGWYWDFGDGTNSSQENPSHVFSVANPHDTVKLIVKNECNCTDTYKVVLNVFSSPGPIIQCTAVQCAKDSASYSTSAGCGTYNWSVSGGSIISGAGTTNITVLWNNVNVVDGFGYVNLAEPCGACPDTSTLKIPVIVPNATIEGPDTICAGQQYIYSLPLWPGTFYHWGVLNDVTGITSTKFDYEAVVNIQTAGTYTLHAWYQNALKMCGGNVTKDIVVVPPTIVTGDSVPCSNTAQSYTLSGGVSAYDWQVIDPTGGVTSGHNSGNTFTTTFTQGGTYVLNFSGGFCARPYFVTVQTTPPAIDSVSGPDTVCLNRIYSYIAHTNMAGETYNWQITGGTVLPTSGTDTVTVVWTSTGTKQLSVNHVNIAAPNCAGAVFTMNVFQDIIAANITGDTVPCANSHRVYSANYTHGETYIWSISPNTAGSVVTGIYGSDINVLWNNTAVPVNATIKLIVTKCDSTVTKTFDVVVQPSPIPTITGPNTPICPGTTATFTAAAGGVSYYWNFGDGITITTIGNTVTHIFPRNPTNGNVSYTVEVTIAPDPNAPCPLSGSISTFVIVTPGPIAYASATSHCINIEGGTVNIIGTVTNNVNGLTYQWNYNNVPIPGATLTSYTTGIAGDYNFIATADNGCLDSSHFYVDTNCVYPGDANCPDTGWSTVDCNVIHLYGDDLGTDPTWVPVGSVVNMPGGQAIATITTPGIYWFYYMETIPDCGGAVYQLVDTIGAVADYTYNVFCGPLGGATPGLDTIRLHDHTTYLPGWTIGTPTWPAYGLTGANVDLIQAAPGTYTIEEDVPITPPSGITYTCTVTHTVILPALPSVSFTDSVSNTCEGVPVFFTAQYGGAIMSYNWDFGDGTGVVIPQAQRNYTWDQQLGDPNVRSVTLTVTDTIGCVTTYTSTDTIHHNIMRGVSGDDEILCSSQAPEILSYAPDPSTPNANTYLWSTGAMNSTIPVSISGAYWVTVHDINNCPFTTPATNIDVIQTPPAVISGKHEFCYMDVVSLAGYAGDGVTYQWLRDNNPDGNGPYISDAGLAVGDYHYKLVLGVSDTVNNINCHDTSADFLVHVYPVPNPPTITPQLISCTPYHLQVTATENVSGNYNWSNGVQGPTIDLYSGGPVEVWFTNQYGCIAGTQSTIPQSPDYYFDYFPSGCYKLCQKQLPVILPGIPVVSFTTWAWLKDGGIVESGTDAMSSYTVTTNGTYNWRLDNGVCAEVSDPLTITVDTHCAECASSSGNWLNASLQCNPADPASYDMSVQLYSPAAGTSYTLGTDMGPVISSSGVLPGTGPYSIIVSFTTLPLPPPSSITVQVEYTFPGGTKCFKEQTISVPACTWNEEERHTDTSKPVVHTTQTDIGTNTDAGTQLDVVDNALTVFPNPSSGLVTLSYNYGAAKYRERMLNIYNSLGQKMANNIVLDASGQWKVDTRNWADGTYLIVMEGDGRKLQTQRLVIEHN